jgi:uncharacterized membrane protein YphA (DoxX/SURF4 family)
MRAMRAESNSSGPGAMIHTGLFLMRAIAGASMIAHHAWAMVYTGWLHFWRGDPWLLVTAAEKIALPQPLVFAVVFSLILFVGSVFLVCGLLGRLTPSALLLASVAILYIAFSKGITEYIETCIVYSAIFVCLAATGPGAFCLDRLFARKPRPLPTSLQDIV